MRKPSDTPPKAGSTIAPNKRYGKKITIDGNKLTSCVAEKIVSLRKEEGLTQGELAELLGLSREAIGSIERGNQGVALPKLLVIAQIFQVPLCDFVPDEYRPLIGGPLYPTKKLTPEEIAEFRRTRLQAPDADSVKA